MTFPLFYKTLQTPYLALGTPIWLLPFSLISSCLLYHVLIAPKPPWFVYVLLSISNVFFSFRSFGCFLSWNTCTRDFSWLPLSHLSGSAQILFPQSDHLRPAQLKALYPTTPSLLFSLSPYFTSFPTQFMIHDYFYVY